MKRVDKNNADAQQIRRRRGHAQQLSGEPKLSAVETVRALLAVQAQDFDSARLALRARCPGLAAADVGEALEARELVIAWLCRGTLHLVCAEDWAWLLSLTAHRQLHSNERRLTQEGVSADAAERALVVIERALADRGPLTRDELRPLVAAAGVRSEGQAMVHLLALAAFRARIIRCDRERYALATDWLPVSSPVEPDAALRELGVRYRRAHALAGPADLAAWAGIPLGQARVAWRETAEPDAESRPLPPKLLASFDEYILGWKDRSFAVPDARRAKVFAGGIQRAVAISDGELVDTWTKPSGRVKLAENNDQAAFADEIRDVERFLAEG